MRLRHLKEEANHLISKGKLDKAAEVLAEAMALEPGDPVLRLRHAECCRKLGRHSSAITSFLDAAELLRRQGHYSRAMAALKLALELAPGHPALQERLTLLSQERQQASGASTGVWPAISSVPGGRTLTRQLEIDSVLAQSRRTVPPPTTKKLSSNDSEEMPVVVGVLDKGPPNKAEVMYPLFRRLSDRVLAVRPSAQARWILVSSDTTVNVTMVDDLPVQPATHVAKSSTQDKEQVEPVWVVRQRRS